MANPRDPNVADIPVEPVEAVMRVARVLVAITARSMAVLADTVSISQFRVLVLVHSQERLNLAAVAEGLGVHPSNATRACDRLVDAGLLRRQDNPHDRRNLLLELTDAGRRLVDQVLEHRQTAIADILARMSDHERAALGPALTAFAEATSEVHDLDAWTVDWIAGSGSRR